MIISKKTLIIIISIVIILVAGYININMSTNETFDENRNNDYLEYEENSMAENTNITLNKEDDMNFDIFRINKEKNDMIIIEQLENNISNDTLSKEIKEKFESMLINKNKYLEIENNISLLLDSKGYNNTVVIVNNNSVKVVTNLELESKDTVKILDVVVSETNFKPSQIKIVKFSNINL